jgi:hypothetical protein
MEISSECMTIFSELFCTDTDFSGVLVSLTVVFYYYRTLVQNCGNSVINNLEFLLMYFMDICDSR